MAFQHHAHGRPQVIQGNFQGRQPTFVAQARPGFPGAAQRQMAPHVAAALQKNAPGIYAAQRKTGLQPPTAQPARFGNAFQVPSTINLSHPGQGRPLPDAVRQKMESFFNTDFSDVRVHTGAQAQSIGAVAFTMGSEIHFAPGQYNPNTSHGRRLLGHELTHVMQQRAGRVRNPFGGGVAVVQDPGMEAEADRMGIQAAMHQAPPMQAKRLVRASSTQAIQQMRIGDRGKGVYHSYSPRVVQPNINGPYGSFPENKIAEQQAVIDAITGIKPGKLAFSEFYGTDPRQKITVDATTTMPQERQVGRITHYEGWKMHVGANPDQVGELARIVLPVLRELKAHHKIVDEVATYASDPNAEQYGKFITIYPRDIDHLGTILWVLEQKLSGTGLQLNKKNKGEYYLGSTGLISTRYGSFTDKYVVIPGKDPKHYTEKDVREIIHPESKGEEYEYIVYTNELMLNVFRELAKPKVFGLPLSRT